jgi:hypothetical protein
LFGVATVFNGFLTVESSSLLGTLFYTALVLLLLVSGGILYLTWLRWQDRRLQERDRKTDR